jgi:DNA-binding MarR family transcriptional regulator
VSDRPTNNDPSATLASDVARLYFAIGRLARALRRDAPKVLVDHAALSALATLIAEGPQRAGRLAETEGVTAPAMTRILGALEKLGYAVRRADPGDGRACLVEATPVGRDVVLSARALRLDALHLRLATLQNDERTLVLAALPILEKLTEG